MMVEKNEINNVIDSVFSGYVVESKEDIECISKFIVSLKEQFVLDKEEVPLSEKIIYKGHLGTNDPVVLLEELEKTMSKYIEYMKSRSGIFSEICLLKARELFGKRIVK